MTGLLSTVIGNISGNRFGR